MDERCCPDAAAAMTADLQLAAKLHDVQACNSEALHCGYQSQQSISHAVLRVLLLWCREFREDQFLDLVGPCFQLLANFMQSAVDFDSQLQVTTCHTALQIPWVCISSESHVL